ncbi:MAG: hypothetical protein ABSA92_12150 [Candidatus Bathyarchaeia archaeon]
MAFEILLGLAILLILGIIYWLYSRSKFIKIRTARRYWEPRSSAPSWRQAPTSSWTNQDAQSRYEESYRSNMRRTPRISEYRGRLEGTWITVKYSNYCLKCSKLIAEGERALWKEGAGIWHGNCRKHQND